MSNAGYRPYHARSCPARDASVDAQGNCDCGGLDKADMNPPGAGIPDPVLARFRADKAAARHLDAAAGIVSGLDLAGIGLDGHGMANKLWRISAYLRRRAGQDGEQENG